MSIQRNYVDMTENFTKRDMANARNGFSFKDLEKPCNVTIVAAARTEDLDEETGEVRHVTIFKTAENEYYTGISDSIYENTELLEELINEEGPVQVRINERKSKNDRDFLTMIIL